MWRRGCRLSAVARSATAKLTKLAKDLAPEVFALLVVFELFAKDFVAERRSPRRFARF